MRVIDCEGRVYFLYLTEMSKVTKQMTVMVGLLEKTGKGDVDWEALGDDEEEEEEGAGMEVDVHEGVNGTNQ